MPVCLKMKNSMKSYRAAACLGLSALLSVVAAGPVRAQMVTGFETSNGYTSGGNIIGTTDLSSGTAWGTVNGGGGAATWTASDSDPASGLLAFNVVKSQNTAASGVQLNLGPAVSSVQSDPFTISFDLNVGADISSGTGNQAQVYYGPQTTPQNSLSNGSNVPYWVALRYNNGNLDFYTANLNGTGGTAVNLGSYTTYSALGDYITFDITIDPATLQYTSVLVSGTLSSADMTATVLASNSGFIPGHVAGTPDNYFSVFLGLNDTGTVNFDNLSVAAVPEPGTWAMLTFGLCLFVCFRKRTRISFGG